LPIETPIFIVGMPRSGTTLVDQILAAHPQVAAAGELTYIEDLMSDLPRMVGLERSLEVLSALDAATVQAAGQRYWARLQHWGRGAARVTDKMPQNFFYLGLISALFPKARVIHCRRNPLDTCLSCYMHNFTDFATSLESLGFYYRQYARLMEHWRRVLPMRMHEVQYEELVAQPESASRELIAFCGLEWSATCLAFHERGGAVHTASRLQVRRPIYTSAVERWRRYEKHLQPLQDALGDLGGV
jgi:hypothetical protein